MDKPKQGLVTSFRCAFEGIVATFVSQRNFRIHVTMGILVLVASIYLGLPKQDIALLILVIGLVMAMELLNTAIEAVVDLVTTEWHPLAKLAKDVAAGAVLVTAIVAVVIGLILFWKPVMMMFGW